MTIFLSLLPILLLIVLMMGFKLRGDLSAVLSLLAALLIALFLAPNMEGFSSYVHEGFSTLGVGGSLAVGALKAIFPIFLIIIMAVYSYNVLVESKQIEVIKKQFTNISDDKRLQVLLVVWGFGGLLEGMAGFGTAVAIPAAILIGLGFKPGFSALVSLISNSVATGFGAVGVPVITLAKEAFGSDVDVATTQIVAADVVLQLSILMFMIPFVILWLTDRRKQFILPNIILSLVVGAVSLIVQGLAAYYIGAETPAILGSLACIIVIVLWAKMGEKKGAGKAKEKEKIPMGHLLRAWAVYGLILVFILLASPLSGSISAFLKTTAVSEWTINAYEEGYTFKFGWLSNAALMLFLGAFLGGLIQGVSVGKLFSLLGRTMVKLKSSGITITSLVMMSSVMGYAGMISVIAQALVDATGSFYPIFAPLVGAIGTFATGSDTSSNILFGKLQADVAGKLELNKAWLAAANTAGATGGKIISPQSIAIATAAGDMQGKEGEILRSSLPYALFYVLIAGLTVYFCSGWALI